MEEFFKQGDLEKENGLDFSPLCDRNSAADRFLELVDIFEIYVV